MASIRQLADCIGLTGNISILGDFLGFFRRRIPPDPTGATVQISLRRQVQNVVLGMIVLPRAETYPYKRSI